MKQRWYKKRRRLTAVFAVAIAIAGAAVCPVCAVSAPFIEYQGWADIDDVVAVSRCAVGNPVEEYEFCDTVFRFDVNLDGVVSEKDAETMADYVQKYALFDAVFK